MTYTSKFANEDMTLLFEAVLELKDTSECYRFFEDLCTIKEIQDMAQRFKVSLMLSKKTPYHVIQEETHASSATISRVNKALLYGAEGYHLILKRIHPELFDKTKP